MATYRKPDHGRHAWESAVHPITRQPERVVARALSAHRLDAGARAVHRNLSQDLRSALRSTTVGELMSQQVMCVQPSTTLAEVTDALLEMELGALPVIDGDGPVLGLVTRADVLRCVRITVPLAPSRCADTPAREVMRTLPFRFTPNYRLDLAVATMAFYHEHHVPVQSRGGDLVGMLTSEDVLHWVAAELGYSADLGGLAEAGKA